MGEERIVRAQENVQQAEHLLAQAKESFAALDEEHNAIYKAIEKPVILSSSTVRYL